MSMMYCPKCEKNVYTKKMKFNIGIAIILVIFTGGIGLLIYMAIYLDKQKRCINCNAFCQDEISDNQTNLNYQVPNHSYQVQKQILNVENQIIDDKTNFCYTCGVKLDDRASATFCAYCGTDIK